MTALKCLPPATFTMVLHGYFTAPHHNTQSTNIYSM